MTRARGSFIGRLARHRTFQLAATAVIATIGLYTFTTMTPSVTISVVEDRQMIDQTGHVVMGAREREQVDGAKHVQDPRDVHLVNKNVNSDGEMQKGRPPVAPVGKDKNSKGTTETGEDHYNTSQEGVETNEGEKEKGDANEEKLADVDPNTETDPDDSLESVEGDEEPLPVDQQTFFAYFRQFSPDIFQMEKDHVFKYDPLDHMVVGEQLRATLHALDLWEAIHTAPTADGVGRWAPEVEVRAVLETAQAAGEHVGVKLADYDRASRFVHKLERNVFHWLPEDQSVLALKHSYTNRKGLVTTMGNHQFASGYSTLLVLRERGCTLPFEIFYLGDHDLTVENREKLISLGNTKVVDLKPRVTTRLGGWEAKPYVLLFSSFREVMIIDSDSLFLQAAERVFEQPGYIENGALFFHDRSIGNGKEGRVIEWMNKLLPGHNVEGNLQVMRSRYMTGKTSHEQESGVVAIDKARRFGALMAVCQLNAEKERDVSYKYVYGDKETFWLGFEMVGDQHWAFSPFVPGVLGPRRALEKADQGKEWVSSVCSSKIVHLDSNAKPLWFNGGLLKSKFVDDAQKVLDNLDYWSIEPGHWLLQSGNVGCLLSTVEPTKVEGEIAEWIAHHQKVFAEVATHFPLVHNGTMSSQ